MNNLAFVEKTPEIGALAYDHHEKTPYDFFKLVRNDDIINIFVTETNRYAEQKN